MDWHEITEGAWEVPARERGARLRNRTAPGAPAQSNLTERSVRSVQIGAVP
jgi:hypothetical protein